MVISDSKRNILVVDDEAAVRRVVEMVLRAQGHRVHLAADGQAAVAQLDAGLRENFLRAYGFTPADWDKIRDPANHYDAGNGANYLDPTKLDRPLSERLQMAIAEQSSYGAHQPDARTRNVVDAPPEHRGDCARNIAGQGYELLGGRDPIAE